MKKIIFLAFLLFTTSFAFAQRPESDRGTGGRSPMSAEQIAQRNTDWMKKDLNLTEAQIAPVDSINLVYAKAQVVLFQSASGDREKIREAMNALSTHKEEALSSVLTKDQMDVYKQRIQQMNERGNRARGDSNRGNNPDRQPRHNARTAE